MAFGRHRRPILAAGRPPSEADFGRWAPDPFYRRPLARKFFHVRPAHDQAVWRRDGRAGRGAPKPLLKLAQILHRHAARAWSDTAHARGDAPFAMLNKRTSYQYQGHIPLANT